VLIVTNSKLIFIGYAVAVQSGWTFLIGKFKSHSLVVFLYVEYTVSEESLHLNGAYTDNTEEQKRQNRKNGTERRDTGFSTK
jgi:hypothetical protein